MLLSRESKARYLSTKKLCDILSNPVFSFFEYKIVTARREILCDGESLAVEPKVYELLLYLLERGDRAVSTERSDIEDPSVAFGRWQASSPLCRGLPAATTDSLA